MVDATGRRWPVLFGAFVLALSLPFWRFGDGSLGLPVDLPVSALQAGCPAAAAVLLVGWVEGRGGLSRLWRQVVDFSGARPRWWLVPASLTAPLVVFVTYSVLGRPMAAVSIASIASIPLLCCVFLIAAVGEEVGWSGYLTEPTVRRFGMLGGSVSIGVIWAAWHLPGWYLRGGDSPAWIAGLFLLTVAFRVVIVWLYRRTGHSLPVAVLCNATVGISEFLFLDDGSPSEAVVAGLVTSAIAAALIVFDRTRSHAGAEPIRRP